MRWLTTALGLLLAAAPAAAATLDDIAARGEIRLGHRMDAAPFSHVDAAGKPRGFTVDLCGLVVESLRMRKGLENLKVAWVATTAENRFDKLNGGETDLHCGSSTVTLSRREQVAFSLLTFVTGTGVIYPSAGAQSLEELKGSRVGVLGGTTNEAVLRGLVAGQDLDAEIVVFEGHEQAVKALTARSIAAYFADRAVLLYLLTRTDRPDDYGVSDRFFSYEPYALAMRRGDEDFRLAVDRALAETYRSGRIVTVFQDHFGEIPPSDLLKAMFLLQGLPE